MRGKSQLDLSLDSGLSQRHLSFIECGRSAPSRETLLDIAQALDIPLRERNTLLLAAGYAPIFSESTWDAPEMQGISKALERVLRQHEPFPAIVMDRYWNVLMTNDSAPRFFNCFIDMAARKGPRNVLIFFSMITRVGAPLSIAAQELRLECMFPADEESEKSHREMMATKPKRKNNAG
jgi:transcriptional regulator with XRE-family HTH domain